MKYRFSYAMRHNDANKMNPPTYTHPVICVIHKIFTKTSSFLKPVLKIFILHNLIVGWGGLGVIKEGAGILHQIYRSRGGSSCWGSRTHQIETKYNLWHFQTSKVGGAFYENCFRKLIDWFHKTLPINNFYVFLVKMLNLKKARNVYTRMLEFTFPGADMINQNGGWKSGRTLQ